MVKVKIKKLDKNAVIPSYAHISDAGCDMVATSIDETEQYIQIGTGVAIELPKGWYAEIFPRSSISKYDLILCNGVGVIDNSYRGEILFRFKKTENYDRNKFYKVGDKIGQMILKTRPFINFEEVNELSDTERDSNGFGSSGN